MNTATQSPGIVREGEALTVSEFRRRTGLQQYALTQCRKAGLRVIEIGRKRYVLGADWLRFLEGEAKKQSSSA